MTKDEQLKSLRKRYIHAMAQTRVAEDAQKGWHQEAQRVLAEIARVQNTHPARNEKGPHSHRKGAPVVSGGS